MFKRTTFKGRTSLFFLYSIVTTIIIIILLFGAVYTSVKSNYQKTNILKYADIDYYNNRSANIPDFKFAITYEEATLTDFSNLDSFIGSLDTLSADNHFTAHTTINAYSHDHISLSAVFTDFNTNFSSTILGVSQSILEWMFDNETYNSRTIHYSSNVHHTNNLKVGDNGTIHMGAISKQITVGNYYSDPFYFFDEELRGRTLIPLPLFLEILEELKVDSAWVNIFIDCDSEHLLKMSNRKIEEYYDTNYITIQSTADKNNVLLYTEYRFENFADYIMGELIEDLALIEGLLSPSYILIILIFWITLIESFTPLKKELRIFLIRGAKRSQFVKHYFSIFILTDLTILVTGAAIGELFSELLWQTFSFGISLIVGILTLIPIEVLKLVAFHKFTKEETESFVSQNTQKYHHYDEKRITGKHFVYLMGIGIMFLCYSFFLPLFLPPEFLSTIIQASRIIAAVILLFTLALFSSKLSINSIIKRLQRPYSSTRYAISRLLQSLFHFKRKRLRFCIVISFWMIIMSTYVINYYGMNMQINSRAYEVSNLDVGFYIGGSSSGSAYSHLSNWTDILSDKDVESYMPISMQSVIKTVGQNEEQRGYFIFLPFANITKLCPSFFSLTNSEGNSLNFEKIGENNTNTLVSREVMENMDYSSNANISIEIKTWGTAYDFNLSTSPHRVNLTIVDDFVAFPFIEYNPAIKSSEYLDFYYLADFELMEEIYGQLFISTILIKLKKDIDPHLWYNRIFPKLGEMNEHLRVIFSEDKIKSYTNIYTILPIEGFIVSTFVILFSLFYFQSIIKDNKRQLLISISRGVDKRILKSELVKSIGIMFLINFSLSFSIGIILSIAFPLDSLYYAIAIYNVRLISTYALIELGGILVVIFLVLLIIHSFLFKKLDTATLTIMGDTIDR
ncbi:hypothetical protein ES705_06888 [subsurface metagenome]|jgi:hypothetical protein